MLLLVTQAMAQMMIGTGRELPVRWIGEQHVVEDCGRIPSLSDWLRCIRPEPSMNRPRRLAGARGGWTCLRWPRYSARVVARSLWGVPRATGR